VTLLVFAALGVLSPFLSYVNLDYYDESVSGWDSQEVFSEYDEFSNSPLLVMLGSLLILGIAIAVVVNQNQGRATNKVAVGVTTLVTGAVVALCAGMAYSSWDSILQYEGEVGSQGIGMWIGAVSGVASVVIGIVMLTVSKVTQGVS